MRKMIDLEERPQSTRERLAELRDLDSGYVEPEQVRSSGGAARLIKEREVGIPTNVAGRPSNGLPCRIRKGKLLPDSERADIGYRDSHRRDRVQRQEKPQGKFTSSEYDGSRNGDGS